MAIIINPNDEEYKNKIEENLKLFFVSIVSQIRDTRMLKFLYIFIYDDVNKNKT